MSFFRVKGTVGQRVAFAFDAALSTSLTSYEGSDSKGDTYAVPEEEEMRFRSLGPASGVMVTKEVSR